MEPVARSPLSYLNPDGTWECPECTFVNEASAGHCEMCAGPLPWSYAGRPDTERPLGYNVASNNSLLYADEPTEPADGATLVKQAFDAIDSDHSGFIDQTELKAALRELGEYLDDEEVKACLTAVDTSGDGKISIEEFTTWFTDENREVTDKPLHELAVLAFRYHSKEKLDQLIGMVQGLQDTHDSHGISVTVGDYKEGPDNLGCSVAFNTTNTKGNEEADTVYATLEFESVAFPGWQRYWKMATKAVAIAGFRSLRQRPQKRVRFYCETDEKTHIVRITAQPPAAEHGNLKTETMFGVVANALVNHTFDLDFGWSVASLSDSSVAPVSRASIKIEQKGGLPDVVRPGIQKAVQLVQQLVRGNPGLTSLHQGEPQVDIKIEAKTISDNLPPHAVPSNLERLFQMVVSKMMGRSLTHEKVAKQMHIVFMALATKAALVARPIALHVRLPSHLGAQVSLRNLDLQALVDLVEKFMDSIPNDESDDGHGHGDSDEEPHGYPHDSDEDPESRPLLAGI